MPSAFDKKFKRSGFPSLLTQFGETVTYRFRKGGQRVIQAIIERDPPAFYDAAGNVVTPSYTIRITNSCTKGVEAKEVDTGGDYVTLIDEIGGIVPVDATVLSVQAQDSGVLHLALM